jgi:hypothetical protein
MIADIEPFGHLSGHQRFTVTYAGYFRTRDSPDLECVLVRHFPAADDAYPGHFL